MLHEAGKSTGDIVKDVGKEADKAGGVVGGGLLAFLSGLLGITPEKLKFYGIIIMSPILFVIFILISLYVRKKFIRTFFIN